MYLKISPKIDCLLTTAPLLRLALSVPCKDPTGLPEKGGPYFQTHDPPLPGLQAVTTNNARALAREKLYHPFLDSPAKNYSFSSVFQHPMTFSHE